MGSSSYSDDFYRDRAADRAAKGTPTFAHHDAVATGKVAKAAHAKLDPKGVTRESRDSAEHPNSTAIAVIFDVTGSMGGVPVTLQAKIPQLMGLLLRKGYIVDPQILFGAVGDFYSDHVPLQVGQFESGIEMDDDITKLYLEGGGGGSYQESYQNALYFLARHTVTDCWEKRSKKGYAFLIGDEMAYESCTKKEVSAIFGDTVQEDVSLQKIVAEVQERYNLFFVIPSGTSHYSDPKLKAFWQKLIGGENVIMLDQPDAVCESVGTAIGLLEGTTDLHDATATLTADGTAKGIVATVGDALAPLASKAALAKVGAASLPESGTGTARL